MEYGLGPVSEARGENPLDTISLSLESGEIETEVRLTSLHVAQALYVMKVFCSA